MRSTWFAIAILVALSAGVESARADSPGARRPGLFKEIRRRLIPPGAADAWREARQLPSAVEALPLMEDLAKRGAAESPAAALWLGHFYYGAGDPTAATPWFERAAQEATDQALRSEARAWWRRCSLVGEAGVASPAGAGAEDPRERLATIDALSRGGEPSAAWDAALELESGARSQGLLGPVLYRLVHAASQGGGDADRALDHLAEWGAAAGPSPDRALARALSRDLRRSTPPPASPPTTPAGESSPFGEAGDSVRAEATPDVERGESVAPEAADAAPETGSAGEARFQIQLGSFAERARAEREAERLQELGLPATIRAEEIEGSTRYQLRWGSFRSREEAEESALARCTGLQWAIVRAASAP